MEFRTDVLGAPYEAADLPLAADDEGDVTATLVRRLAPADPARADAQPADAPLPGSPRRAVLYVHGYIDYFFQTHLADFYVERGFDFYALDLRKYGRSLRPHQSPNFVTDLAAYDEEIDAAVEVIREQDGHTQLLLNGHSTGGLVAALWADRRAGRGLVDGLFLNSPFLSMPVPAAVTAALAPVVRTVGRRSPLRVLPTPLNPHYVHSIHQDFRGSWDFDLAWKPAEGFPMYAGWLAAIHQGHRQVRRGLAVDVPVLLMASTASVATKVWDDALTRSDGVLRADDIARLGARLGGDVTTYRVQDGLHDLMLSGPAAREAVFTELGRWLDRSFAAPAPVKG